MGLSFNSGDTRSNWTSAQATVTIQFERVARSSQTDGAGEGSKSTVDPRGNALENVPPDVRKQRRTVFVVGSYKSPSGKFALSSFVESCEFLGKALAEAEFRVIIGSSNDVTADFNVLAGIHHANRRSEVVLMRRDGVPESAAFQRLLTNLSVQRPEFDRAADDFRHRQVEAADLVIAICGGVGTRVVMDAARRAKKPLIPLGAFSGSAQAAWPAAGASLRAAGISRGAVASLESKFEVSVIVGVVQSLLSTIEHDADGLFTVGAIRNIVWQSGLLPANDEVTGELLLYDAYRPRQHTWLVASTSKVAIVLDDEKTRAKNRLVQRVMDKQQLFPLIFGSSRKKIPTVGFAMKPRSKWYYSRDLYPETVDLEERIRELVSD